jgi:hypothetical protein
MTLDVLNERQSREFWILWVAVSGASSIVFEIVDALRPRNSVLDFVWSSLGFFTLVLPQWFVLHRYSRFAGLKWWRWALAFVIGAVFLAVPLICVYFTAGLVGRAIEQPYLLAAIGNQPLDQSNLVPGLVIRIIFGIVTSLIFAYFQWRVLRNFVQGTRQWMLANAAAGAVTAITEVIVLSLTWSLGPEVSKSTNVVLNSFISAAITGGVLAWMLRQPPPWIGLPAAKPAG